ncbi:hypothetical protein [Sandarakinorhabdus oryzae]|uniref:hypothetical protein n=1 Tax=Sandarakinorhabdus oryzae TaxID=2675220 RepID=UPI0012E1BE27|nr:hypothetical protein [Sandarakinorhabdus oryzae]
MISLISLALAVGLPRTTVELFNCDFVRVTRFDANEKPVVGKRHHPLMIFVRRPVKLVPMADVFPIKLLDPTGFVSPGVSQAFISSDGGTIFRVRRPRSSNLDILVKAPANGKQGREAWVLPKELPKDMTKPFPEHAPMFVGVCNTGVGTAVEKMLGASR